MQLPQQRYSGSSCTSLSSQSTSAESGKLLQVSSNKKVASRCLQVSLEMLPTCFRKHLCLESDVWGLKNTQLCTSSLTSSRECEVHPSTSSHQLFYYTKVIAIDQLALFCQNTARSRNLPKTSQHYRQDFPRHLKTRIFQRFQFLLLAAQAAFPFHKASADWLYLASSRGCRKDENMAVELKKAQRYTSPQNLDGKFFVEDISEVN